MSAHDFTVPQAGSASGSADTTGDRKADAIRRFGLVNAALAQVGEGTVLMPKHARRDVWLALESARDPFLMSVAKRLQVEATGGRPLTVCFGRRVRRIPGMKQFVGTDLAHTPYGDGCGVVFADSTKRFCSYCPDCRRKPGGRLAADVLRRTVGLVAKGRFPVVGGWRVTCSGCGVTFSTTTPQRSRCDSCQH
jgi:hypothetical protein